jgi:hypothetical protein
MLMVVKLKTLEMVGLSGGVIFRGLNKIVPGVVKLNAPSAPVDPLL